MPTPFTHLYISAQLAADPAVQNGAADLLRDQHPAFLLGGVIADQKPYPEADRSDTHFYSYEYPMEDRPWRVMLARNPALAAPADAAQRAFVAGYVAHLAADEFWTLSVLRPHFALSDWGKGLRWRFYVLHYLLTWMDERDEARLPAGVPDHLRRCLPAGWLPFMPDAAICEWRDFIASQIEGQSQTVPIFAGRVGRSPDEFNAILRDPDQMHEHIWQHFSQATLQELEAQMYVYAREQLLIYLDESAR